MSNFTKSILYSTTVLAVGLISIFAIYDYVSTQQATTQGIAAIEPASGEGKNDSDANTSATSASLNDIKGLTENPLEDVKEGIAEIQEAFENIEAEEVTKTPGYEKPTFGVSAENIEKVNSTEPESVETEAEFIEPAAGTITESIVEEGSEVIEKAEDISGDIGATASETAEPISEAEIQN
ncbi:MAG: hypothetical protein OEY94_03405 [Alphaproteobacteria bacterium]|nr:hypothetical protein [Alphaproteobacteria bacterium]